MNGQGFGAHRLRAALALSGAVLLAACGGSGDDGTDPSQDLSPAASCFDAGLYAAGARVEARYRHTDSLAGAATWTERLEVLSTQARFNGVDGLVQQRRVSAMTYDTITSDAQILPVTTYDSYLRVAGPGQVTEFGTVRWSTRVRDGVVTTVYDPPFALNLAALQPGQSASVRITGRYEVVGGMFPGGNVIDSARTVRFVGREWVQTPAGRFAACRLETLYGSATDSGLVSWVYRGVTLRTQSFPDASTQQEELQSATVNGQKL